jgi:hypothetical protein
LYSSTFIFAKKQYDDKFHSLDAVIAEVAKTTPGYFGYRVEISEIIRTYGDSRLPNALKPSLF